MNFKQFLNQLADNNGQVIVAHEPIGEKFPMDFGDSFDNVNVRLDSGLEKKFESVKEGLLEIAKILFDHGIDLSEIKDIEEEGDEFVVEINNTTYLYVVYSQDDNGLYDFYAEMTDEDGLEEILEDDDEIEED